ncbi:MAG: carbohydrate-binding protein, partial [Thermoflexales bacterium]
MSHIAARLILGICMAAQVVFSGGTGVNAQTTPPPGKLKPDAPPIEAPPPSPTPARETNISPTPAAPAERNGTPLEVGKVLEVKDGGWPDQSTRVAVVDMTSGIETRLPLAEALTVLESKIARQVSPFGIAFPLGANGTLARQTGLGTRDITLDYSALAFPAGGDMEGRLQFVLGEDCGLRTGETAYGQQTWYDCARWTPLPTQLDRTAKRASVNVAELPGRKGDDVIDLSGDAKGEPPPSEVKPSGTRIIALATGGSSAEGDYRASMLDAVGDYQVGLYSGAAELGYPIPVPPAAAGAAPEVRLGYSSGSIDGFGGNKNGQPGWAGLGWNLNMGSVTRGTRQCSSTNLNRCVIADKFTLTLNGHSSELVRDTAAGAGRYRLQDDPTWRVELKTSSASGHPDQQKEYFLVTTPDGTQYRFGGEIEPETNVDQDSAFYVPIYDLTLCAAVAGKLCNKIWQWNLDRVQDTDGNVVSYFYEQELNYYAAKSAYNAVTYRLPYVRAGNVARIEYSKRNGVSTSPHARVLFGTELRCSNPTQASNCVWPANFIDTPSDLACLATGTCAKGYPTYWTQRRLNHARTQTWDQATSAWKTAGYYEFGFDIPSNGAGSIAKLLMTSITQRPGGAYERSAFSQIEAEDYNIEYGTQLEASDDVGRGKHVAYIGAGDYLIFKNVDFGGSALGLLIRASNGTAANGTLEFRIDSQSGQVLAGFTVPPTGGWQTFNFYATGVTGVSGVHDLYVRFTGGNMNLNWFRFTPPNGLPGLPSTTFDFKWLDNRKDVAGGVISQTLARVMTVTNGLGGQTVFSYGQSHPCPSPYPSWV